MAAFRESETNNIGGFASDYFKQFFHENKAKQTPIKWQNPKDIATKFSNRVLIESIEIDTAEHLRWCKENSILFYDYVSFRANPDGRYMGIFSFSKPSDAMAFKLRWT